MKTGLKALKAFVTAAVMLVTATLSVVGASAATIGDANNDGVVNTMDAAIVLRLAASNAAVSSNQAADVDNDGKITAIDAAYILRRAAGMTVEFPAEKKDSSKTLVAFFSWSGTSEGIANDIISNTGADSYRIERKIPYSDDYNTVARGEAKDEADTNAHPELKNDLPSIDGYDTIVLCYPIWWHTCPMTVGTFLNNYDFSGKTIIPVSQSASMDVSQYDESVRFIKDNAKNAEVLDGVFSRDQSEINSYLSQNGINQQ